MENEKTDEQVLIELKAHAYDVLTLIEQYRIELSQTQEVINQLINKINLKTDVKEVP